eukprot:s347_g9.t1
MASPKLEDIFSGCGVTPNLASDLLAEGWSTKTFAFSASDETGFDVSLPEICATHGDVSLLQKAALRAASHMARHSQVPDSSGPSVPSEPAPSSEVSSWTEAFAPKMEHAMVQKLKDAFLANYPSELLTPDLMPSLRLLSLVYSQLQKKQWRWIPWKYRMSVARADEVQGQRLLKMPKLEGMQLHSLLSASWWSRLGGWLLRTFHGLIWFSHCGMLYVDDFIFFMESEMMPVIATMLSIFCQVSQIPISWKKSELGARIQWIG